MRMDRTHTLFALAAFLLLASGCDQPQTTMPAAPTPSIYQAGAVDPSFRLSPAQRASVRPEFDANALERLLRMLPPERRAQVLSRFQQDSNPGRGFLVSLGNPDLDTVLEEVWAPYWRQAPDEALTRDDDPIPGKRIERARRAAERAKPHP